MIDPKDDMAVGLASDIARDTATREHLNAHSGDESVRCESCSEIIPDGKVVWHLDDKLEGKPLMIPYCRDCFKKDAK